MTGGWCLSPDGYTTPRPMINLLISVLLGGVALTGAGFWVGWFAGIFPGVAVMGVSFFLLARRTNKQLEAQMPGVQKAIMARKFDEAIRTLEAMRPLGRWQFLVSSALDAQIGMILYAYKQKPDEARPYLEKAFMKQWQAQAMLGAGHYKKKNWDKVEETFKAVTKSNKKVGMLWATWAWTHWKRGNKDQAIDILARGLKKMPDDEKLKTNLLNLQNNRKLKMKVYAEEWWALLLERPPVQMQQQMGGGGGKQRRRRR